MADSDQMNVVITADGSAAAGVLTDITARLDALEASFHKVPPAASGMGAAMEELNGHVRTVTMGLGAMGLEADAAAVKMEALASIVKLAEESFGPLLLIGAAIAAMGAAFSVFKDGVSLAADFESQMVSLGTAVRLSGGDWDKTSEQVKKYLEIQEQATGYDQNEVLTGLNKLVVAGASVRDAEYEVAVAEDAARATHKDLLEVVQTLISAEGARATGLERLDPRLKTLIERHASLFEIMQQLERDMSGQAAASMDTFSVKVEKMNADFDTLKRDAGDWLIPWLDKLIERVDRAALSWAGMGEAIEHHDLGKFSQSMIGYGLPNPQSAQQQRQAQINSTHGLDTNPTVGNSAGGGGYDPNFIDVTRDSTNYADPSKQTAATSMMKAFADVEGELEAKMKSASSTAEEQADKIQLLTQKYADAKAEANALAVMVEQGKAAWQDQVSATEAAHASLNAAQVAENSYEQSLKGTTKETDAQKDQQHNLAAAVKAANDKFDEAKRKLDQLGQAYKALYDLQEQVHRSVISLGADAAAATNAEAKADADYYAKAVLDQSEFVNTFEKTNAQKVHIYDQMIAHLSTADVNYADEVRDLTTKRTQAWEAALEDEAKAYKTWIDNATKETETFIDDVVLKHETMRDELKNIFESIEKNYIASLSKMLIGGQNGSALGPLAFLFGSPTTSGGGGFSAASGNARNGSTASNAIYVIPTDADSNFLSKTTGNITGVSPTSITAGMNSTAPSVAAVGGGGGGGGGLSGIAGILGAIAGGTGVGQGIAGALTGGNTNNTNGVLGGLLGGGLVAGGLAAGGGALLTWLGAGALAGPLGIAAGAVLGATVGSLVGPKYNPTTNPDMYNASSPAFGNYGQFMANVGGQQVNINGNTVTPDNQYYTANGGTSLQSQIESEINSGQISSMTPAQQQLIQQLEALNGGAGNPNGLNISYEHQGQFGFASGATTSVSNYENLVAQYQSLFGSGSGGGSPIYSIGRSYPDFNLGTVQNTGLSTPAAGGTSTQVGSSTVIINNPTIVGPTGLNQVAVAIGQALKQAQNGQVIGSPSTYRGIGPTVTGQRSALA